VIVAAVFCRAMFICGISANSWLWIFFC
jgi:hypothetical protein